MQVIKLTPHIGAEVSGVDITQPLSGTTVKALEDVFHENQVIFFRNQPMTLDQHVRFGRYFGELYTHPMATVTAASLQEKGKVTPGAYASPLASHPEIIRIYADGESTQAAGETWHADVTSEPEPPMGSILHIEELPPVGGDTLFCSMYAAYDALSPDMKRFLESLTAIHDGQKFYASRTAFDATKKYQRSEHPVIRTHPRTGRQALYVHTTLTTRIVQLPKAESDAILEFLFRHVERPIFQCRWRWEKDSVAFWDNRCTLHQAMWDYFPQRRVGYRVQVNGDKPFYRATQRAGATPS
jgi:taurine dioxygenase